MESFYRDLIFLQGPTALVAKVSLLLVLYLVHSGNERPGFRLLTSVLLAHFLIAAYLTTGSKGAVLFLPMLSLAMAAAAGYSLAKEPVRWVVLPGEWRGLYLAGYLLAFWFPFWPNQGPLAAILFSPMAALPHQSLLVLLVLSMASGGSGPVALRWTGAGVAAILGIIECVAGWWPRGAILLLASGVCLATHPAWRKRADPSPDQEPSRAPAQAPPVRPATPSDPPQEGTPRKWDIR